MGISLIADLHCHTSELSPCGLDGIEQMVASGVARGLKGLVITDHDRIYPYPWAARRVGHLLNGMALHLGVEVSCYAPTGEMAHILVFGGSGLEGPIYDPRALAAEAEESGAALVLAHPYRYDDGAAKLARFLPLSAIEVASCNVDSRASEQARRLAESLGLPMVAGSDAHRSERVGLYATRFERWPNSLQELAEEIRAGRVEPVRWNKATEDWE